MEGKWIYISNMLLRKNRHRRPIELKSQIKDASHFQEKTVILFHVYLEALTTLIKFGVIKYNTLRYNIFFCRRE